MRSTRGDILDQALQRVGNTTASLKNAGRFRLNRILQELYQGWDWPFLWTIGPLTIQTNGFIALPDNFVKPEDDQSLMITSAGGVQQPSIVTETDHRAFQLQQATSPNVMSARPRIWTIDYGNVPPVGRAWPLPTDTCQATFRYKFMPPDFPLSDAVAYDADVPIFQWDVLLTDLMFEWAQSYEVDPRRGEQYSVNADTVNRARGGSFPERSYPATVQLDPLVFSTPTWGYGRRP